MQVMTSHDQKTAKRKGDRVGYPRRGVAAVEFAIVANILFVLILAGFEFARLHLARNLVQDAAYFAARQAMVPGATVGDAEDEAERILNAMFDSGYEIIVDPLDDDSDYVIVQVSIDLQQVAFFTPMFLPNQSITSVAKMRTERYHGFYEHGSS